MTKDKRIHLNMQCCAIMEQQGIKDPVARLDKMTLGAKLTFLANHLAGDGSTMAVPNLPNSRTTMVITKKGMEELAKRIDWKLEAKDMAKKKALAAAAVIAPMSDEDFLTLAFKKLKKTELKHLIVEAGCTTFWQFQKTRIQQLAEIAAGHREPCWTCRDIAHKMGFINLVK